MTLTWWLANLQNLTKRVCFSIYTLTQFTKVYKNMDLISWSFLSISSKTLLFLSFQMVHIRQRGTALQAFSLFLPTKDPCHPRRFLFTEKCITHCTPKMEKIRSHNILAFSQNKRRWYVVSSSYLHKKHLLGMLQPNLFRQSMVSSLHQAASHPKKLVVIGTMPLCTMQKFLKCSPFFQLLLRILCKKQLKTPKICPKKQSILKINFHEIVFH